MKTDDIYDPQQPSSILCYCRVSSQKQRENYSIQAQQSLFEKERDLYSWDTSIEPIVEVGSGTSISERPGMQEVLRRIRLGDIDALFVVENDRLCRPEDLRDLQLISEVLIETETLLLNPHGRKFDLIEDDDLFTFDILGVLAKRERKQLLRRTRRGKMEKARQGRNAAGSPPYGYRVDSKTRKYIIEEAEAEVIRTIFNMIDEGLTIRETARELTHRGIRTSRGKTNWSVGTLQAILTNSKYQGIYVYNRVNWEWSKRARRPRKVRAAPDERIEVGSPDKPNHPPIISSDQWTRVRAKIESRSRRQKRHYHLLTGILTCPDCGKHMRCMWTGGRQPRYVCADKPQCRSATIPLEQMDETAWNGLLHIMTTPSLIEHATRKTAHTHNRREKQEETLRRNQTALEVSEAKRERLLELYLQRDINRSRYATKDQELADQIKAMRLEIQAHQESLQALTAPQTGQLQEALRLLAGSTHKLTPDRKSEVFRSFVRRITLEGEERMGFDLFLQPEHDPWFFRRKGHAQSAEVCSEHQSLAHHRRPHRRGQH